MALVLYPAFDSLETLFEALGFVLLERDFIKKGNYLYVDREGNLKEIQYLHTLLM